MHRSRFLWLALAAVGVLGSGCVVVTDDCVDTDGDLFCDDEDPCPFDATDACVCVDDDLDNVCDDIDVCLGDPTNTCIDCEFGDVDVDGFCDLIDDCWDDVNYVDMCGDGTKECIDGFDNFCQDWFGLYYCVDGDQWFADCNTSCQTDDRVWGEAGCNAPALSGDCDDGLGACVCYCEDAFDQCVNDYTIQYTRDGNTFQLDCKEYCNGSCDAAAGACLCP